MLFQILDDKSECAKYYVDGKITEVLSADLTATWKYAPFLKNLDVNYAFLYCGGKSLEEVCPEHLKERWSSISQKLKAFFTSFREAKISLDDNCFFDLVPEQFLLELCDIKNQITEHVLETHNKPENYEFLASLTKVLESIKAKKLNVDSSMLRDNMSELSTRKFIQKLNRTSPNCVYKTFGTKTGRLTTQKSSFPILTMSKEHRKVLKPTNDYFIELDFNAAELRTLLALSDKQQPLEDIHEWNLKNVYRNIGTRKNAKERIFAWLYNSESQDHLANRTYDRGYIKDKYWNGSHVINPFGRLIESDEFHAVNYLVQSTASDIFLRQAIKIHDLLDGKNSFISFLIHDSLVIDFSKTDSLSISEFVKIFSRTNFGDFRVNIKVGKNFGEMRELKWNTTNL